MNDEPGAAVGAGGRDDVVAVDLLPNDLALARAQLASGLAPLAEATLRRHAAQLELDGLAASDEMDAVRALLAEVVWRQGRPLAASRLIGNIRPSSPERRAPRLWLIEAEADAASGQPERAQAAMERIIGAVGISGAWELRGGMPSRLPWPLPEEMRPQPHRAPGRAAQSVAMPDPAQTAAAHARLEAARAAYASGDEATGDHELALAVRLDTRLAAQGIALLEPQLGEASETSRLLLYGDLLRAAGRSAESAATYDRADRASS